MDIIQAKKLMKDLKSINDSHLESMINFGSYIQIKIDLKGNKAVDFIDKLCKKLNCQIYNPVEVKSGTYYNLIKL